MICCGEVCSFKIRRQALYPPILSYVAKDQDLEDEKSYSKLDLIQPYFISITNLSYLFCLAAQTVNSINSRDIALEPDLFFQVSNVHDNHCQFAS